MADLPTNFLDDILSTSMGGKRRFKITRLDGTSEEVTIEDISKYDQVGSTFGAGDINKTNQAVNEKFDSGDVVDPMLTTEPGFAADAYQTKLQFDAQNKNLGGLRFGVDGVGNGGYYKADDSFVPFKKQVETATYVNGTKSIKVDWNVYSKVVVCCLEMRGDGQKAVSTIDKNGTVTLLGSSWGSNYQGYDNYNVSGNTVTVTPYGTCHMCMYPEV